LEAENVQLDLNYIPRYINSSIKQFAPDERHVSRYNRQNILILVFEGSLCFEEDGDRICLEGGEYYIQTMGHWQTGNFPSNSPRYCFINFSGQFTDRADRALAIRGSFEVAALEPICKNLCAVQRSLAKSADVGMVFEVQRLFFDVLNGLYKGNIDLAQKKSLAERIYDHITEHFAEEISLSILAERFNYSEDHVTRVFKSMYRITPYQYLLQCRVCYAKLLLSSEGMRVSEVAMACGFSDASTFYRAFMKLEGISPAQYRISKK
jgi:AraC-like DNA-binding protein